jgi:hypothetical protein
MDDNESSFFLKKIKIMKIQYNTEVYEFENYDELDEYIVVDDEWKKIYGGSRYFSNYKVVKVWKNGRITDKNNKNLKIEIITNEYYVEKNGKKIECKEYIIYWKFGRGKYDLEEVREIIWDIYSEKYNSKKSILNGDEFDGLYHKDGDYKNVRLDNLIKYEETNEGTEIYDNSNKYFDFNLNIPNDYDEFIQCDEPVILDDLPYFQIYRNGNIVDTRGKSGVLLNKNGYQTISYKSKNYMVHRLIAKSYLKNKYNYDLVNHIDGNRSNNDLRNLEYINNTINTLHGLLSVKIKNWEDLEKYGRRSNGVNGWISLTSKGYRDFVKKKIIEESFLDKRCWIFSHKTPIFLLFLPLVRKFGNYDNGTIILGSKYFNDVVSQIDDKFFKNKDKLSGLDIENNNNSWLLVECINKYLIPEDQGDHLLNILSLLKIDFDNYIDFLFDDLKIIIKYDVGFIFFKEFKKYIGHMRGVIENISQMTTEFDLDDSYTLYDIDWKNTSNGMEWINQEHQKLKNIRNDKSRNILVYEKKYGRIIDYNYKYHRIVERLEHVHIHNVKILEIEDNVSRLMSLWVFWKRHHGGIDDQSWDGSDYSWYGSDWEELL